MAWRINIFFLLFYLRFPCSLLHASISSDERDRRWEENVRWYLSLIAKIILPREYKPSMMWTGFNAGRRYAYPALFSVVPFTASQCGRLVQDFVVISTRTSLRSSVATQVSRASDRTSNRELTLTNIRNHVFPKLTESKVILGSKNKHRMWSMSPVHIA